MNAFQIRRHAKPQLIALVGAMAVTGAIAVLDRAAQVPNLSALYLLLVLWLGSRYGIAPAATGSVASFLLYDFFFVPPAGSLLVSGPRQAVELAILLAAALVTGQLAGALRRSQGEAAELAAESQALYELATVALRLPDVTGALDLLCERARALDLVRTFTVLAPLEEVPERVAGDALDPEARAQAAWSLGSRRALGCTTRDGKLTLMSTSPRPRRELIVLPLNAGGVVAGVESRLARRGDLHMLSALAGLADLLLERRRAALESERAQRLEASDNLKTAVLSSISHELKSPLTSLRAGLTALASPASGLDPDQRELLRGLDGQALRLDRLVGDLLAMSLLEAGGILESAPHSLAEIVGGVAAQLREPLSGYRFETAVADDLPLVAADELQLHRVFVNLLENAMQFTPPGRRIAIGAERQEQELIAWVDNEGPPIPHSDLDRLFDKFWTRRAGGSGLGLAICKRIVEAHGGGIRARNLRTGPRFTLSLPLAVVSQGKTPR